MDIFYNKEDNQYYTIPDGDIATSEQIKEYYKKYSKEVEIPIIL